MSEKNTHQVILFYKYMDLINPELFMQQQRHWCKILELKGRTIIASEGINSTLEGTVENIAEYIRRMSNLPEFADIHWKKSFSNGDAFSKLSIRVRDEIVSTHLPNSNHIGPTRNITGKYITPEQLHSWIESKKEFYIVDMRNDYEHQIGHFKDSILPKVLQNFRDLPKVLPIIEHLKNKTIVTVCTGGIRCEKASGFLVDNGYADVYQLSGGIVSYMEKYPNQDFHGKLYVFDKRLLVAFESDEHPHVVVGKCQFCGNQSENIINYIPANTDDRCNGIVCLDCLKAGIAKEDQGGNVQVMVNPELMQK